MDAQRVAALLKELDKEVPPALGSASFGRTFDRVEDAQEYATRLADPGSQPNRVERYDPHTGNLASVTFEVDAGGCGVSCYSFASTWPAPEDDHDGPRYSEDRDELREGE